MVLKQSSRAYKGHDGNVFDSIVLGKFICCLAQEKQLIGELNLLFLDGYTANP